MKYDIVLFEDSDRDLKVSPDDIFYISTSVFKPEYYFSLKFDETGEYICEASFSERLQSKQMYLTSSENNYTYQINITSFDPRISIDYVMWGIQDNETSGDENFKNPILYGTVSEINNIKDNVTFFDENNNSILSNGDYFEISKEVAHDKYIFYLTYRPLFKIIGWCTIHNNKY